MLSRMVSGRFEPHYADSLPEPEETADSFLKIAEQKAVDYSKHVGGLAIATDGGASFPGLKDWNPLTTKRFVEGTDEERISAMLEIMNEASDRTVEWREAVAIADNGELLFSAEAKAMDGVISRSFDSKNYQPGIWLCSITEFPTFGGKNFFDLSDSEREQTEDSWAKLEFKVKEYLCKNQQQQKPKTIRL